MSYNLIQSSYSATSGNYFGVASSSDGSKLYACVYNNATQGVVYSDGSWTNPSTLLNATLTSIACSSNGSIVYVANNTVGIQKSTSGLSWTLLTGSVGGGKQTSDIGTVACSADGQTILAATLLQTNYIYQSTNGGTSWNTPISTPGAVSYIACSSDAAIIYAILNNFPYVYSGGTWTLIPGELNNGFHSPLQANWKSVACSADGSIAYFVVPDGSGSTMWAGIYVYAGAPVVHIASSYTINRLACTADGRGLLSWNATDDASPFQAAGLHTYSVSGFPSACFLKGTGIRCSDGVDRPIETLHRGDIIKTLTGERAIHSIGKSIVMITEDTRDIDHLYCYRKESHPDLTADLVVTGGHSVLIEKATPEQATRLLSRLGTIFMTDGCIRMLACLDDRAEPYLSTHHTIYHIALESADDAINYGIYANGMLVESCQQIVLAKTMTLMQ